MNVDGGVAVGGVAALAAVVGYVTKVIFEVRSRSIADLSRFIEAHRRLFEEDSYIHMNLVKMEQQGREFRRDRTDDDMEHRWHLMLIDVESLALLAKARAIPKADQVYMFAWYAEHILRNMEPEKSDPFYELALGYLTGLVEEARRQNLDLSQPPRPPRRSLSDAEQGQ